MTSWKDLKDQPIYIVGLAIVASISATAAFYEKFLVPARDPNAIQRAAILQSQLDTSQRLIAEIQPLQQRLQKAEAELAERTLQFEAKLKAVQDGAVKAIAAASERVQNAEWANTFAIGSPYPIGLDSVKVGDSADKLSTAFPGALIDRTRESYYSMDPTGHAVFDRATFYFDEQSKDRKISHIVYWSKELERRRDHDWLVTRLTTSLGTPKPWGDNHFSWEPKGPVHTFVRPGRLAIMRAGERLNSWPKAPK